MKNTVFIIFVLLVFTSCSNDTKKIKENWNKKSYPFNNPVIQHMYTADPAPKVMPDGRVWMVTSVDHEEGGGYATMHKYHTFSSDDMVNWIDHGEVFNIEDASGKKENSAEEDWALWAPDWICYNGLYYLYYPVRIRDDSKATSQGDNGISYIGVAVSNHPSKRFKVINPHIMGTKGIDPSVFIDNDGQPYLYWGDKMAARLNENMMELAEDPVHLDLGTDNFMEAIWMDKHEDRYIVSYHTLYDWKLDLNPENIEDPERKHSNLAYSYSESPMGPFKYGGVLNEEPGANVLPASRLFNQKKFVPWRLTLSNHGGVLEYHLNNYLFYHTSALSSWRQDEFEERGTWTQRSVCVDKLQYDSIGFPITVKQTLKSVEAVSINQHYEFFIQREPVIISEQNNILKFEKVDLGTGYYYFDLEAKNVNGKVNAKIYSDSVKGKLLGTLTIVQEGKASSFLRGANGLHDIFIVINKDVEISNLRFYAGCPQSVY